MRIVLSVGGSIINPGEISTTFLKQFKDIILDFISKGNHAIIVCGGGAPARIYQNAAKELNEITDLELDLIGIKATRLNAELVRSMFYEHAYEKVVEDPTKKVDTEKPIIVGAGWLPGYSSDKDAVYLAENFGADTVINMTNIDYVYDKDPNKFNDAKPLDKMTWDQMREIVGDEWKPGLNMPFDPIASKLASEIGIRVVILNADLDNFKKFLNGEEFKGTQISDN